MVRTLPVAQPKSKHKQHRNKHLWRILLRDVSGKEQEIVKHLAENTYPIMSEDFKGGVRRAGRSGRQGKGAGWSGRINGSQSR